MITYAEINLEAARRNSVLIKEKAGRNTAVMAVVKADAYSHGAVEIANAFLEGGAGFLAVADSSEGIKLRSCPAVSHAGRIVILNPILPEEADNILEYDLTPTVDNLEIPELLSKKAKKKVKIHVEVDTGMGRGGFIPDEAVPKLTRINQLKNIVIEGIFTHFPSADDRDFTMGQIAKFKEILLNLENAGINIRYKHSANSAGLLNYPDSLFNMVRPGLCLYGIFPPSTANRDTALEPVLVLKSKIINIREVPKGTTLSYGRTYTTTRKTLIGTIPAGYSCGYDRRLSNRAEVLVRGKRCPIAGTICMDSFLIDLSDIPGAETGDETVLIGKQGNESISVEELAEKAGTVSHEIIARLRVPRTYTGLSCK